MNEVPKINNIPWDAPLFRKAPLIDLNTVIENLSKASYHYADDSGSEWGNAAALVREAARKLAEERLAKAVEGLSTLNKAAGEVARQGAVTGTQWTKLNVALLRSRAALKEIDNG